MQYTVEVFLTIVSPSPVAVLNVCLLIGVWAQIRNNIYMVASDPSLRVNNEDTKTSNRHIE